MLDPTPPAGTSSSIYTTVALVSTDWQNGAVCGMCIQVTSKGTGSGANPIPSAPFTVFVNNQCPSCASGGIDLGLNGDGAWDMTWKAVACPVTSAVQYVYKSGSSVSWAGVQVRNTKYPVFAVSLTYGSTTVVLTPQSYNYYTGNLSPAFSSGNGTITITSVTGEVVTDSIFNPGSSSITIGTPFQGGVQL